MKHEIINQGETIMIHNANKLKEGIEINLNGEEEIEVRKFKLEKQI